MARLPESEQSSAVLIGTSTYHSADLTALPAVRNNVEALASILTDPTTGWCRPERCTVVHDPADERSAYRTLVMSSAMCQDTFLVYFAGHGFLDQRNRLHLGLVETSLDELAVSAMRFEVVRDALAESPAKNRVLILDCCFSGRALSPMMTGAEDSVFGQVAIEGTYVLTATPGNEPALAPAGSQFTAFSGELIDLLRWGCPDNVALLTPPILYRRLLHRTTSLGLPRPVQRGTGTVDGLALSRNTAFGSRARIQNDDWTDAQEDELARVVASIARRILRQTNELVNVIDELETNETDPELLDPLFRVDHLTCKLRRDAEGYLLLAGEQPTKRQDRVIDLADVIRVAAGETTHYARVQARSVDPAAVYTSVAVDLAHLLSDLIENAAGSSPSDTIIEVTGNRANDGRYWISITDLGQGLTPSGLVEANQTLSNPPLLDHSVFDSFGLAVVSHLAARHRISVELDDSPHGGTVAKVGLPGPIIVRP